MRAISRESIETLAFPPSRTIKRTPNHPPVPPSAINNSVLNVRSIFRHHSTIFSFRKLIPILSCSSDSLFNTCPFESSGSPHPNSLVAITLLPKIETVFVLGVGVVVSLVAVVLVWMCLRLPLKCLAYFLHVPDLSSPCVKTRD